MKNEENLAGQAKVRISCSVEKQPGAELRDIPLLRENNLGKISRNQPLHLWRSLQFNSFSLIEHKGPIDFTIHFPQRVRCNCIEMTMGFIRTDGGWWTSLGVEYSDTNGDRWQPISELRIEPPYPFQDAKLNRKPFTTYLLQFPSVTADALRLKGDPGGVDRFVCLSQLAVFNRNFLSWNRDLLPRTPIPAVVETIPPDQTAGITESFGAATGLEPRIHYFNLYQEKLVRPAGEALNRDRNTYLANFLTKYLGYRWRYLGDEKTNVISESHREPTIRRCFHKTLANIIAPINVDNRTLAYLESFPYVIIEDEFELAYHRELADLYKIPWDIYRKHLEDTPQIPLKRLDAIRSLFSWAVDRFTAVARANLYKQRHIEDANSRRRPSYRSEIVERAVQYMRSNCEQSISMGDVAEHLRLTTPYFSSLFKKQTGRNPNSFFTDLKIERAKAYFIHTNFSILDVAVALNFSRRHFSRIFKQQTGFSPRDYISRVRN